MSDRFTKTDLEKAKEATKRIRDKRAQKRMKNSRPEKKGSSITDIFKSYGKYDGKPIELKGGGMSEGQKKLAGKAPPPNKIDAKDFAVLRAEKAKGRGMGLQDESVKPGKVKPVKAALGLALGILGAAGAKKLMKKKSTMEPGVTSSKMPINLVEEYKEKAMGKRMGGKVQKANLGLMFMKKAKDKGAKGMEFLSPLAMLKRISGKKMGGVAKYKRGKFLERRMALAGVNPFAKQKLGEAKDYKKYLKGLKKATSEVRGAKLNSPAYNITTYDQKSYKRAGGKGKAVFKDYKGLGIKNEDQYFKEKKKYSSMAEMRKAKGFKPGESASQFNKRRMALAAGKQALKATTIGKIALGVGAAGVAAQQYLKSKMKKKDEPKKKMGGGMMQKPMGYKTGGGHYDEKNQNVVKHIRVKKKMGGGMMQKPMGYSKGTMIKARGCKLGRTRPTKIT